MKYLKKTTGRNQLFIKSTSKSNCWLFAFTYINAYIICLLRVINNVPVHVNLVRELYTVVAKGIQNHANGVGILSDIVLILMQVQSIL